MFSGYSVSHPPGGSGLGRWQRNTTPSAQDLAQGTTPAAQPQPGAGTVVDTTRGQAGPPPVRTETPAMRAARMLGARQPPPAAAPPPAGPTLRPPPPAAPPPTSLAPPPGRVMASPAPPPAPAPAAPPPIAQSTERIPVPEGWVDLGGAQPYRTPLNIDGTALSGAQLAALAGTGQPGDPFTGGFSPIGGWNAGNGGRSAAEQAAAVAAYKAQYGDPGVTVDQVHASASNDPNALEAARRAQQEWQDSVGRFL